MSDTLPAPAEAADPREFGTLARKMSEAYTEMMTYCTQQMKLTLDKAQEEVRDDSEETAARRLTGPASALSWWDLTCLAEEDPAQMLSRWEAVKQAARDELASGQVAGEAVLPPGVSDQPMDRARFLAVLQELTRGWDPQNGMESLLLEQMAQSYIMQLHWQGIAAMRTLLNARTLSKDERAWELPRVDQEQAVETATAMVDRWNRMFLRQLRALRDMRRFAPVIVQNAGQVNIGEKQINVGAASAGRTDSRVSGSQGGDGHE